MAAVESPARVDVGALAASIKTEAYDRVASALSTALSHLEDDGNGLNELQRGELIAHLLWTFDGFERAVVGQLVTTLKRDGVDVWGLDRAFEDLTRDA